MTYRELNLPQYIYDKIKERCDEQGSFFDIDKNSYSNNTDHGFDWTDTIENKTHHDFWFKVLRDGISLEERIAVYKTMYQEEKKLELISESERKYRCTIKGKLYEIVIKEVKDDN